MKNIIYIFLILILTRCVTRIDTASLNDTTSWTNYSDSITNKGHFKDNSKPTSVYYENDSNLWIGTGSYIYELHNNTWVIHKPPHYLSASDSVIMNIESISKNPNSSNLIFSSRYYGFSIYNGKNWIKLDTTIFNEVHKLQAIEDIEGNIFITTSYIYTYPKNFEIGKDKPKRFNAHPTSNLIHNNKGEVCFLLGNRLYTYKNNNWSWVELHEDIKITVYDNLKITFDKNGDLWILASNLQKNTAIYKLNKKKNTVEIFTEFPKFFSHFRSINIDDTGRPWVTCIYSGYFYFENNEWHNLNNKNSIIQGPNYWDLYIDSKDNIWFITDKGLYKYIKKEIKQFAVANNI